MYIRYVNGCSRVIIINVLKKVPCCCLYQCESKYLWKQQHNWVTSHYTMLITDCNFSLLWWVLRVKSLRWMWGVYQGSEMSLLLFMAVREALTCETMEGLVWELLYPDDFVLVFESMGELKKGVFSWRSAWRQKRWRLTPTKERWWI